MRAVAVSIDCSSIAFKHLARPFWAYAIGEWTDVAAHIHLLLGDRINRLRGAAGAGKTEGAGR